MKHVATWFSAIFLVLGPASLQANDDGTGIVWDQISQNFGTATQGELVTIYFMYENHSDEPVTITEASPSCGCTVANYTETVQPGQRGFVQADLDTAGRLGAITRRVDVQFDNGHRVVLSFSGVIEAP